MQDVLLEPFGGEILGLSVSGTTFLTAAWASGALLGFGLAGSLLYRGYNMHRVAALGALIGILAFTAVILSSPLESTPLFVMGVGLIGFGGGLFAVSTMLAAMALADRSDSGFAIGAWSAVQACAIGLGLAAGGIIRDTVNAAATTGALGEALHSAATGYNAVYHIEIILLFVSLVVIGPLTNRGGINTQTSTGQFGLAELPG